MEYIMQNPTQWDKDKENPKRKSGNAAPNKFA